MVKAAYSALDNQDSSISRKFTEAHYISLFHSTTAPSTNSWEFIKQRLIKTDNLEYNYKQRVKTETAKCESWCPVSFFFLDYIYIMLHSHDDETGTESVVG